MLWVRVGIGANAMTDTATHKVLRVSTDDLAAPYIKASREQLDKVHKLLEDNGIGHWVDHHVISVDGGPFMGVIYLRRRSDPQQVQAILDAAV
jgi:hypothetical protein